MSTTSTLKIYRGILPNFENNLHYVFADYEKYITKLSTNLVLTLTSDNYRINGNICKITTTTPALTYAHKFSYIIEILEIDNVKTYNCYYVRNILMQSGNIILELEKDYFGSYIGNTQFENIHVTRCNKNISNYGIYDDFSEQELRDNGVSIVSVDAQGYQSSELSIVIKLAYQAPTNLPFVDNISQTALFAFKISDLANLVQDPLYTSDVDIALDIIGGIYAIEGVTPFDHGAEVIKAWIIPTKYIPDSNGAWLGEIISKCKSSNWANLSLGINKRSLMYKVSQIELFSLKDIAYNLTTTIQDLLKTYHIEFGCFGNYLPLTRHTYNNEINLYFVFNTNGVSAYINQGLNTKDISKCFEIDLSTNNQSENALSKTAEVLKDMTSILGATIAGNAVGGIAGAVAMGATSAFSMISKSPSVNIPTNANADGMVTIGRNKLNPFVFRLIKARDETTALKKLNKYGVNYDCYINSFYEVEQAQHFANGESYNYIVCDLNISGIAELPAQIIKDKFNQGLKFEWVD